MREHGTVRHGMAWHDMSRHDMARRSWSKTVVVGGLGHLRFGGV
jgi:hypothetical protein